VRRNLSSHTQGAIAAARRALPNLGASLARGDLSLLVVWLGQHVHASDSRIGFLDLLVAATGNRLDAADFEAHLASRHLT
jgi:Zn-dependent M32 family carboxypeptidase